MIQKLNKALFYSLFFLLSSATFADWNPNFIEDANTVILENPQYKNLKAQVIETLKGSWCSQEKATLLMDLIMLDQPQTCVEIGVWTGSSLLPIGTALKFLKKGKVYAIDAWSNKVATRHLDESDPNKAWWSTVNMSSTYRSFRRMLKSWRLKDYCKELLLPSEEAVTKLDTIDFLHLDGDYSEIGSMKDVELYLPKVKSGGYILISNLFTMVNGKQPKAKSFYVLVEECEFVCEIERDNAILFRKY